MKDVYLDYPPPPPGLSTIPYSYSAGVVLGAADGHVESGFPSGTVSLDYHDLIPNQDYDVIVEMHLPTSPSNRDIGNFMVDLELWSPPTAASTTSPTGGNSLPLPTSNLLHRSLRPAILTYHSPVPSFLSTLLQAPLLLLSLTKEQEFLAIPLLSRINFPSRSLTPSSVKLTLRAPRVQTYKIQVKFKARLGWLRHIMYNYRLAAAVFFINGFWAIEIVCAMGVWWALFASRAGTGGLLPAVVIPIPIGPDQKPSTAEEEEEEEEHLLVESEPIRELNTPRQTAPGREYLPSPSPTPQPEASTVREGYAVGEDTETEGSDADAERLRVRATSVELETETEEEGDSGSEEEAVMVSQQPGQGGVTDSGIGSSTHDKGSASSTGAQRGVTSTVGGMRKR